MEAEEEKSSRTVVRFIPLDLPIQAREREKERKNKRWLDVSGRISLATHASHSWYQACLLGRCFVFDFLNRQSRGIDSKQITSLKSAVTRTKSRLGYFSCQSQYIMASVTF